jgi:hypothetical protein
MEDWGSLRRDVARDGGEVLSEGEEALDEELFGGGEVAEVSKA